MSFTRLPDADGPTYMWSLPITSRYGAMVASFAWSPPTMKKISPDTAWGCDPSIGVSMCVIVFAASAAEISSVISGLTVEQSHVTRPALPPAPMPSTPR